jgi:hypothetical protein
VTSTFAQIVIQHCKEGEHCLQHWRVVVTAQSAHLEESTISMPTQHKSTRPACSKGESVISYLTLRVHNSDRRFIRHRNCGQALACDGLPCALHPLMCSSAVTHYWVAVASCSRHSVTAGHGLWGHPKPFRSSQCVFVGFNSTRLSLISGELSTQFALWAVLQGSSAPCRTP